MREVYIKQVKKELLLRNKSRLFYEIWKRCLHLQKSMENQNSK